MEFGRETWRERYTDESYFLGQTIRWREKWIWEERNTERRGSTEERKLQSTKEDECSLVENCYRRQACKSSAMNRADWSEEFRPVIIICQIKFIPCYFILRGRSPVADCWITSTACLLRICTVRRITIHSAIFSHYRSSRWISSKTKGGLKRSTANDPL